jgi:hypothetical protein
MTSTQQLEVLRSERNTLDLKKSLKILRVLLNHLDPLGMGAFHLRGARYRLLRANGVKAHRTYPHYAVSHERSNAMAPHALMRINHIVYR